jgi:hypothetical protein
MENQRSKAGKVATVVPIGHTAVTGATVKRATSGFAPMVVPMSHTTVASCAVSRI